MTLALGTPHLSEGDMKEVQKRVRLDYIVNMAKDGHFKESVLMINNDMSVIRIILGKDVNSVMKDRESFIEIVYNALEEELDEKLLPEIDRKELITKLVKKIALWRG